MSIADRLAHPNILYIHSHDTGRYVQPYGHAVPTPNIQRLAEQGILFRKAFCVAPTCSPSRAGLLTGQYAHSAGMLGLAHRGFSLNDYNQHIIHTLRKAGYYSALIGEEHISKDPNASGYDLVTRVEGHQADLIALATVELLTHSLPQPFFLSVGFIENHREFLRPSLQEDMKYSLPPAPLPDTPEVRHDMGSFKASAWALDHGIGTVLEALDAHGLSANTLVICTTDHGMAFPRMKGNLTDHGTGVMLIMRGPGGFTGGKVSEALVSHIDLFPTICDLLNIDQPPWLQGKSIMPLIRGEYEEIHDALFSEETFHAAYEPQRAIRTRRWKYIRRYDHHPGPILSNCDDSPSKQVLIDNGWQQQLRPLEQLYDLIFDPNEACNLAYDRSVWIILEELRERLDDWMRVTDDPLLNGPVLPPSGSELNDMEQISPSNPTHIV
jgi:N-sulfoglucosamine sulfohydrolase